MNFVSILGLLTLLGLAWAMSYHRTKVSLRPIFWGLGLQFLLALIIFLLILGAILDIFSALVLVVPLILPIASRYGIDPIHLGILFLATMELGYLTPPVGLLTFVVSGVTGVNLNEIFHRLFPFIGAMTVAVFLLIALPGLATWLPELSG